MKPSEVITALDQCERRPTALAIGMFDGVHRGHQQLLDQLVAAAAANSLRPAILTFYPHPKLFIQNRLDEPYYLATVDERARLISAAGVELIILHAFDDDMRQWRAAEFVAALCQHLDLKQLWGGNFGLGYQREGDYDFLAAAGVPHGFTVHRMDALANVDGERVSSTRIRKALNAGDIATVNACLGRPYRITGEVVTGAKRGRTIGFPTANVASWPQQLRPANGVYATRVTVDGHQFLAATNVGQRPTVDGQTVTIEAHLLDFSDDLYGKTIDVDFHTRIRAEQKFDGLDALKAQISADVAQVRNTN